MTADLPPDFVGVGAQRCGTTWWYELICTHPHVRPGEKELHFFDRFCTMPMRKRDIDAYHRRFRREPGQLMGEWTPRYALDFWTPPLLKAAAPRARLLLMVRDPIDRFASGVVYQCRLTPPRNEVELATIHAEAAMRGFYGAQIRRLLEVFDREQLLVLQYERCVAEPKTQLRRTFEFIGLDPSWCPTNIADPRGTSTGDGNRPLPVRAARALAHELQGDLASLQELVPDLDVDQWPELRRLSAGAGRPGSPL